jgi:ferredoxin-type protein NapH
MNMSHQHFRMVKIVVSQKVRKIGIITSFLLFPVVMNYFSPILIINSATQGIINGSLVVFAVLFLSSLLLGRFWCGWLCPIGGLQEACFIAVDNRAQGGKYNLIKYIVWVPWLLLLGVLAILAGGYQTIDFFFNTERIVTVDEPIRFIPYYMVLGTIFLIGLKSKRAFCHYGCWISLFPIFGQKIKNRFKWPSYHLEADTSKCVQCGRCTRACPMSLEVMEMVQSGSMENSECILCGTCVSVCPEGAIETAWRWYKKA